MRNQSSSSKRYYTAKSKIVVDFNEVDGVIFFRKKTRVGWYDKKLDQLELIATPAEKFLPQIEIIERSIVKASVNRKYKLTKTKREEIIAAAAASIEKEKAIKNLNSKSTAQEIDDLPPFVYCYVKPVVTICPSECSRASDETFHHILPIG